MFSSGGKLSDYATVVDCEHKTAPSVEEGFPLIRTPNINRGSLQIHDAQRVTKETYDKWTRRAVPRTGDLIMAREAPVGNVGIVRKGTFPCLGQRTVLIQPNHNKVDASFLNYVFSTDAMHAYMNMLSNGATVGHLNVTDIRRLALPSFPYKAEQRKIAAVLTAYDDLIENNRQRIALLEKMAEEIYREWFVRLRFPGHEHTPIHKGVPEGWIDCTLADICDERRDGVNRTSFEQPIRYVGLEHIPRKTMTLDDVDHVDTVGSNKFRFREGDVLFGKIRPYLHKVSRAWFAGVCSTDAIVLRPKHVHYAEYLLLTVSNDSFIDLATTASKGTKMPRADWNFLSNISMVMPSGRLMEQFSQQVSPLFELTVILTKEIVNLRHTRNLLLNRLISGKLRVDDLDIAFPPSMAAEAEPSTAGTQDLPECV